MWLFLTIGALNKDIKTKENFEDSHGHNILRLFDVWPNFSFITSKAKPGY